MKQDVVVRALIRLYPSEFRRRYGEAMVQFHRERSRAGLGLAAWLRVIVDHVSSAVLEHLRARRRATAAPVRILEPVVQDVRYALRALARRPGFTIAVLAVIGLGVGANTAIFSVVHAVLLRPLPYREPDRVISFGHQPPLWLTSDAEFLDYRGALRSFERLAAFTQGEANLATEEEPERVAVAAVTLDFFEAVGQAPMIGRAFAADDELASTTVAIVSHALWQRHYAGDPAVVGRRVTVNGRPRTIIGVMPRNFDYPTARTDLWLPMPRIQPREDQRANHYLFMVGRLRPDVTIERARAEAVGFARRMLQQHAHQYDPKHPPIPVLNEVSEDLVGGTRPYLWALFGAVGFVLLTVCANIANLLLARGEGRRKEMGLRSALGASRGRLVTQLLAEAFILAIAGGALGVALAYAIDRALIALAPAAIPRVDEIGIDTSVLAYALATSLAAGLVFGVVPAFRGSNQAPAEALKKGGRSGPQGSSRRTRQSLVIAEVALAVVTLTGAGMLLRSLVNLMSTDLGFDARSTLTAKVSLLPSAYDEQRAITFFDQLLERVRALPGVEHVGAAGWLPVVEAGGLWGVLAEGQSYETIAQGPAAAPQQVTPGYFHALGIPIVSGRDFNDRDRTAGPFVGIISQSMAEQLWPGSDPLGKRFRLGGASTLMTVVGVVGDIRARGFTDTPEPTMYFPYTQTSSTAYFMPRSMSLVVRTKGEPLRLSEPIRGIVQTLDATVPVSQIRTLEQVVGTSVADRRFSTILIAGFGALALLLAGVGLFGVVSYGVSERRFEIGVRMALGAKRGQAMALVAGASARMALIGIAVGLAGAMAVARAIRSLLFGVPTIDAVTLLAVSAALVVVVIAATVLPAREAMAVDPTEALRDG